MSSKNSDLAENSFVNKLIMEAVSQCKINRFIHGIEQFFIFPFLLIVLCMLALVSSSVECVVPRHSLKIAA